MSTSGISVGGLVSGIDTNSLVDQLVSLEQQKVAAVQKKQSQASLKLTTLGTVQSMLSTLSSKATALYKQSNFSLYKASSTNDKVATISGTGSGIQGNIGVNVQQLATTWKVASSAKNSQVTALGVAGTLNISKNAAALKSDGATSTVSVKILAGDTLKDIAAKINAASGAGVTATVANFGGSDNRLLLNGVDQGSDPFTITEESGGTVLSGLGLTSSSTVKASSFQLRQQSGGAATGATKLGELYTGLGLNNIDNSTDKLSFSWSRGTASGSKASLDASTISGNRTANLADVTVEELRAYMAGQMGATVTLNSSGELVAKDSGGGALDFTWGMAAGSTGTIPLGGAESRTSWKTVLQEGRSAFYTMNGLAIASSSNEDSNTLTGATISLHDVSETATDETTLSLSRDNAGIQAKVTEFLDAFNSLNKYVREKSSTKVESKTDSMGMTKNQVTVGELTFDSTVRSIVSQLRDSLTKPVAGLSGKTNYDSLASVGIVTNKENGYLEVDSTKFQAALAADFDGVTRLFSNSGWTDNPNAVVGGWTNDTKPGTYALSPSTDVVDGVAGNRVGDILFSRSGNSKGLGVTVASSVAGTVNATFVRGVAGNVAQYIAQVNSMIDGSLKADTNAVKSQIESYNKQINSVQERVDRYRSNLVSQFTGMEKAMLNLKSQSSAFMAQIGSLG
ncbi:MAG TPA: flagellar filament capping protein FliD [Fibrobacteria bacterium]|nr:flagellar filament capping protein FliD [Fibrobacteria bacterium]HOX50167.1 flagellar filament capping protein FliD [Fibrobacteria bacterium]